MEESKNQVPHNYGFRIILMIILVLFAFWLGIKLGEVKGAWGYGWGGWSGYGRMPGMMMGGGYGPGYYSYGPGMMGWYYSTSTP